MNKEAKILSQRKKLLIEFKLSTQTNIMLLSVLVDSARGNGYKGGEDLGIGDLEKKIKRFDLELSEIEVKLLAFKIGDNDEY